MGFFFSRTKKRSRIPTNRDEIPNQDDLLNFTYRNNDFSLIFEVKDLSFSSRTLPAIFTYVINVKFSRTDLEFHGQLLRYFHVRVRIFTQSYSKIFTQGNLFFKGKKKALLSSKHILQKLEVYFPEKCNTAICKATENS